MIVRRLPFLLRLCFLLLPAALFAAEWEASGPRQVWRLEDGWASLLLPEGTAAPARTVAPVLPEQGWQAVRVPHAWGHYEGFRQRKHTSLHGNAWYQRSLPGHALPAGDRLFLFFEGVGSTATVWLNGTSLGTHEGGLTSFTLEATSAWRSAGENTLVVLAEHPASPRHLPWACGGCERAYGFSEGSQPLGIFRPVHLVQTGPVRVAPFGIHAWADFDADGAVTAHIETELSPGPVPAGLRLRHRLLDDLSREVTRVETPWSAVTGSQRVTSGPLRELSRWAPDNPKLYRWETSLLLGDRVVDSVVTRVGFRQVEWTGAPGTPGRKLLLNGKQVFLQGVADYEHLLGGSHAFSDEQVAARVSMVRLGGFNAFRDAHHPHNLRFQEAWDEQGILWWPQFGSHIWFDNPDFRQNFLARLKDWVRERRNSPSAILWGLQNESVLPTAFAEQCVALLRDLDPTASRERLITTCNGGTGVDWNVPQNWSGTYSGDPFAYDRDLLQQSLVGEFGAWRSLGFHSEGEFQAQGPLTEDRLSGLFALKLRLAESVRDQVAGHFMWPLTSHANPGRTTGKNGEQLWVGWRELDHIGPVNNKGLFTIWGEPTDAYYLYRALYAPLATSPSVYFVSSSWPTRWTEPGVYSGLLVYSNCEAVELFNGKRSLGRREASATERGHFRWDNVLINESEIVAVGYRKGIVAYRHRVSFPLLPASAPEVATGTDTAPLRGHHYWYRINCGGPRYVDSHGQTWEGDQPLSRGGDWGYQTWAEAFPELPVDLGSQRRTFAPIDDTRDAPLYQTYRYGRDQLRYRFALPAGDYTVELFFCEPWYGVDGSHPTAWRRFDVALNGDRVLRDVDIFSQVGAQGALKIAVPATVTDRGLEVSFPRVAAGQAILSAVAISSRTTPSSRTVPPASGWQTHLDYGDVVVPASGARLAEAPAELLAQQAWLLREGSSPVAPAEGAWWWAPLDPASVSAPWLPTGQQVRLSGERLPRPLFRLSAAAGQAFPRALAPSDALFFRQERPLPPADSIATVASQGASWTAAGGLRGGRTLYADGGPVFTRLTQHLRDADRILTSADASAPQQGSFTVQDHVEVFVGVDARLPAPPAWLASWVRTDWQIGTSQPDTHSFVLWRQRFTPGQTVVLGLNENLPTGGPASPYIVLVRPVRPASQVALGSQGNQEGKTVARWTFAVGVGDRYNLNYHYRHTGAEAAVGEARIIDQYGKLLRTDPVSFAPTAPDQPGLLRTRTGQSINAGTYTLELLLPATPSLSFGPLDVE